jgi:site-specific recombinase XerD
MNEEWQEDSYIKAWLGKLNSERTAQNYLSTFPNWLTFIKMSPTEQIEKRIDDLTSHDIQKRSYFEDKLLDYKKALIVQGYSSGSVKVYLTSVLSFFSHNRLGLQLARGDLAVESTQKTVKKWIPFNEEVRAVYSFLDSSRDRAILLLMYHSGLNSIDIRNLNVEDLPTLTEDEHSYFEHKREKTDILTKTCISSECVHELLVYLRQRNNPTEGALFVTHKSNRIDNRTINDSIKSAVEKAHPKRVSEWQTKNLRSSYNDALLRGNIQREVKDRMMGHKLESARSSYECSENTIREAYQKAFKYLSINHGTQAKTDLVILKQEHEKLLKENEILASVLVKLIPKDRLDEILESLSVRHSGIPPTSLEILEAYLKS